MVGQIMSPSLLLNQLPWGIYSGHDLTPGYSLLPYLKTSLELEYFLDNL